MKNYDLPVLGSGAGLRHEHFDDILATKPLFHWFEIITENFLGFGGYLKETLLEIARTYPIIGHGVCLSVGSTDPLDISYLKKLRIFLDEIGAPWASDHLCFTMVDHTNLNDLIPLPFTDECVKNCVQRLKVVQEILERPFLVENVTRYITVSDREMNEAEFISRVVTESGCGLLLDVTNVYLNAQFHHFDPHAFIRNLPLERVGQVHLAGWEPEGDGTIIDSHDAPVPPVVWDLFKDLLTLTGPTSVLIEWDAQIPPMQQLLKETELASSLMKEITGFQREKIFQWEKKL